MLTLTRSRLDDIVRHALAEPTREVCGILGGRDGHVHRVYRGRNVAETPETRYSMDPHDILAITEAIANDGLDLVGIYHSHTHTEAYPSPTDVAVWPARWYEDAVCVICSLQENEPRVRAFRIEESGQITEAGIAVEE